MKVSSSLQPVRSFDNDASKSLSAETQARPAAKNDGPLGQLRGRSAPRRSATSRSLRAAPASVQSTSQATAAQALGMPFHANTGNDCGLHTIAALTDLPERDVVNRLGLTPANVQYIIDHGMTPELFTQAIGRFTHVQIKYQVGTPQQLADALHEFPNGERLAIGMDRYSGIGHLVAAERQGDQLMIWDRQINHAIAVRTKEELLSYFNNNNVSKVHTWSPQP